MATNVIGWAIVAILATVVLILIFSDNQWPDDY
jgi:hypothetical protein